MRVSSFNVAKWVTAITAILMVAFSFAVAHSQGSKASQSVRLRRRVYQYSGVPGDVSQSRRHPFEALVAEAQWRKKRDTSSDSPIDWDEWREWSEWRIWNNWRNWEQWSTLDSWDEWEEWYDWSRWSSWNTWKTWDTWNTWSASESATLSGGAIAGIAAAGFSVLFLFCVCCIIMMKKEERAHSTTTRGLPGGSADRTVVRFTNAANSGAAVQYVPPNPIPSSNVSNLSPGYGVGHGMGVRYAPPQPTSHQHHTTPDHNHPHQRLDASAPPPETSYMSPPPSYDIAAHDPKYIPSAQSKAGEDQSARPKEGLLPTYNEYIRTTPQGSTEGLDAGGSSALLSAYSNVDNASADDASSL